MTFSNEIRTFLREIVLTPMSVETEIREKALNFLLGEDTTDSVLINVYYDLGGVKKFSIRREDYTRISNLINVSGSKIDAIKFLRTIATTGLREAKNTIDNWQFGL